MYIGAVVALCAVNCVFYMDRIKSRPTLETPHTCIIVSAICNYFTLCKIIQCKKNKMSCTLSELELNCGFKFALTSCDAREGVVFAL